MVAGIAAPVAIVGAGGNDASALGRGPGEGGGDTPGAQIVRGPPADELVPAAGAPPQHAVNHHDASSARSKPRDRAASMESSTTSFLSAWPSFTTHGDIPVI